MARRRVESTRKRQLIDATMEAIHDRGFCEVTVSEIAKRAGVSYGLAHHYFGSKDQLLTATMRHLLRSLGEEFRSQLAHAKTPEDRVRAIILASFAPGQFQPVTISAWLAFYMQAQTGPSSRHLLRIYARRLRSNFCYALGQRMPRKEAIRLSEGAAALIDGLWIRWALSDSKPPPDEAAKYAEVLLGRIIGGSFNGQ